MKQSLAICLGFITCAVAPLWPLEIKEARGKLESLGEVIRMLYLRGLDCDN